MPTANGDGGFARFQASPAFSPVSVPPAPASSASSSDLRNRRIVTNGVVPATPTPVLAPAQGTNPNAVAVMSPAVRSAINTTAAQQGPQSQSLVAQFQNWSFSQAIGQEALADPFVEHGGHLSPATATPMGHPAQAAQLHYAPFVPNDAPPPYYAALAHWDADLPFLNPRLQALPAAADQMPSQEAFDQAFAQIDEEEFQREMDIWMERNGPEAEYRRAMREAANDPEQIDMVLEELAEELETLRANGDPSVLPTRGPEAEARLAKQEQDDLVKAAVSILESVKDNQSEKFKNSSFLELMRRIQDKEVTVVGDSLVDVGSGETIVSKGADNGEGGSSTAATNTNKAADDTAIGSDKGKGKAVDDAPASS